MSISLLLARNIMEVLGPEEIERGFGITLSRFKKWRKRNVPFSEKILKTYAKSHMLVLGVPKDSRSRRVTINYFRQLAKEQQWKPMSIFEQDSADFIYQDFWSRFEKFANKRTCEFKWYLVPKSIRDDTRNETFEDGIRRVGPKERVEHAIVYVYAMLLYARIHGYHYGYTPFYDTAIWTSDLDSHKQHVYAGSFASSGPLVGCYQAGNRFPDIGFAPCVHLK